MIWLANNPVQLEHYNSNYDLNNQEKKMSFETTIEDKEPYEVLLLTGWKATCEKEHKKMKGKI